MKKDGRTARQTDERTDGRRERYDETNIRFFNIANAPENKKVYVNAFQQVFF
jgi:hypothetical protein